MSTIQVNSIVDIPGTGAPDFPNGLTVADRIIHTGDTDTAIRFPAADTVTVETNGVERIRIDSSGVTNFLGNAVPQTTNLYDLGTAALRWRNIYTQDLHLSNGIGDYTVVEGIEDLFLVNNKTGKSFKFALIEVDPKEVPPKSDV